MCGNSRAFLVPKAKGVPWEVGAVGNAKWTGVSLNEILERAGIGENTVEVVAEGADEGEISDDPKSPGSIHFVRSLPLEKARRPEVLLAFQMNGVDLTPEHGFPLRLVVPGWYGMASIKWLRRRTCIVGPFPRLLAIHVVHGLAPRFRSSYLRSGHRNASQIRHRASLLA